MRATKPAFGITSESAKKNMARAAVKRKGYKIQAKMLCMMGGSFYVAAWVQESILVVIVDSPPGRQDKQAYGEKRKRDVGFLEVVTVFKISSILVGPGHYAGAGATFHVTLLIGTYCGTLRLGAFSANGIGTPRRNNYPTPTADPP
ncbi:hypothetical protein O988_04435 [Pseudogymnoascus sp. VKM F-3808]|nr:hypothetical protein O988_04435 [Pseudogymnoascus sp. VKM F-3808]